MRYHFFLHYGWFFQNLGKEGWRTFMHTTVFATTTHYNTILFIQTPVLQPRIFANLKMVRPPTKFQKLSWGQVVTAHKLYLLPNGGTIKTIFVKFLKDLISSSNLQQGLLKFIHFKKATKFCEIFTLLLSGTTQDKSKVKISQNFVAFSEYRSRTLESRNKPDELRA